MLLVCATIVLRAILVIAIERHIDGEVLGMLVFGVNVAFLLMRRSAVSVVRQAPRGSDREPEIEGWLAGTAALILFGAIWYSVLFPITVGIWNWYWTLSVMLKALLFVLAGTYFIGLVWLTLVVPFSVAGHFYDVAVRDDGEPDNLNAAPRLVRAQDARAGMALQSLEILPMLKAKYPYYLRPEITSVRFGQTKDRCYLEIHLTESVGGSLQNDAMKREDLGFITDGAPGDRLFFDPARSAMLAYSSKNSTSSR